MAGERTYPILPCADLDETVRFYQALGFEVTYRQLRPNPHAVVAREDIQIHLSGIEGFDPAGSYASVIITVPDADELYESFREGLKEAFGRVPTSGIPRMLPVRRKAGTATGFSVVDAGGNWLRFYRAGATEDDPEEQGRTGLGRAIDVAARQGDARGDEARAISVLDAGMLRYPDAPPAERFEALLYRAELKARVGVDASDDFAAAVAVEAEHELGAAARDEIARVREALES